LGLAINYFDDFRLRPDVRDRRQTDKRRTASSLMPPPRGGGITIAAAMCRFTVFIGLLLFYFFYRTRSTEKGKRLPVQLNYRTIHCSLQTDSTGGSTVLWSSLLLKIVTADGRFDRLIISGVESNPGPAQLETS